MMIYKNVNQTQTNHADQDNDITVINDITKDLAPNIYSAHVAI